MKKPFPLTLIAAIVLLNAACTIPLPSPRRMPAERQQRPIPDVMPKEPAEVIDPKVKQMRKVELTRPNGNKSSFKPGEKVDPAVIQTRLQEAADAAAGAESLATSAETKPDWDLVFAQWNKAIATLNEIPAQSRPAPVKQAIATYQSALAAARQTAQAQLNPKIAKPQPVQPDGRRGLIVGGEKPLPEANASPQPSPSPDAAAPPAAANTAPGAIPPTPPPTMP
ncbi:MAG: hypothetical protein VKJ24_11275 [Synechococcales bacterium]|nr:hypothetical protein [Synechococcales bacterium]